MASDLLVALGQATVSRHTLFGSNAYAASDQRQLLHRIDAGNHPPDESVRTTFLRLPQARQTLAVLGCQRGHGWGFVQGVNDNHVAVGVAAWHSRIPAVGGGLCGTDLTRLALERSPTALHAVEVLADLVARHGQCPEANARPAGPADNLFLIADPQEAFVVEAAGRYCAILKCQQVRAVTNVALVRQDWQRLSPGLSAYAIENGWWDGDGSKLDFAGCLEAQAPAHAAARRRWGRATLALEQQSGAIDGAFLRRLLFDHHDGSDPAAPHAATLASSFMTALTDPADPILAWCAFGNPRAAVFMPVWLDGEFPAALHDSALDGTDVWRQTQDFLALADMGGAARRRLTESLERLQTIYEQEAEAFLAQARRWKRQGEFVHLRNEATALMEKHVGLFARTYRQLHNIPEPEAAPVATEEFVSYLG